MRSLLLALAILLVATSAAAAHDAAGWSLLTHADTRDDLSRVDVAATAAAAAAPDALPYGWCGDERTSDDVAHAALPAGSPRFKIVYAHPADRADRFAHGVTRSRPTSRSCSGSSRPRAAAGRRCGSTWARAVARSTSTSRSST